MRIVGLILSLLLSQVVLGQNYFPSTILWEGERWTGNVPQGNWFPTIDSGGAHFGINDISWGQIRTLDTIGYEKTVHFTTKLLLTSGGGEDIAFFGFGDQWAAYAGNAVGVCFYNGIVVIWEKAGGTYPSFMDTIGTYSVGDSLSFSLHLRNDGEIHTQGPGFNHSYSPSFLPSSRILITTKDTEAGQGFTVTRIHVIEEGLVAYYPFSGNPNDSSGNENNGTITGAMPTTDRFGNANSAYHFNGSAFIKVNDASSLDVSSSFTFSLWVRLDSVSIPPPSNGRDLQLLLGKWSTVETDQAYTFEIADPSKPRITARTGVAEFFEHHAQNNIAIHNWHHLVITYDGLSIRHYIDGMLDHTISQTGQIQNGSGPLTFGAHDITDPTRRWLFGSLDDIRIYDRALSDPEIQSLYHEGGWDPNLVAYYPFNGNANDESGNGHNGTVLGALPTEDRFGNSTSALLFDGNDDYVEIQDSAKILTFDARTQEYTVCLWSKTSALLDRHKHMMIDRDNTTRWSFHINHVHDEGGKFDANLYDGAIGVNTRSQTTPIVDQWYFLVQQVKEDSLFLYVNGEREAATPLPNSLGDTRRLDNSFTIGGRWHNTGSQYVDYFLGSLDDIRIYNYALSEEVIDSLYHVGGWPFQQTTWQSSLTAFDACDTLNLVFGQAPLATDCIDSLYGELELPPPPPAGDLDARFLLPCSTSLASLRDFRSDSLTEVRWVLKLQACSPPITLQWDTASFPSGCMYLKDSFGGSIVYVNMKTQTSFVVPAGITELWIDRSEEVCRTITTHTGWNMISLPVSAPPNFYLTLLPDAVSHPFRYTPGGYIADDTLDPGTGYWVKFNGIHSYDICGCTLIDKKVVVSAGWNMVGPFEDTVLVSQVTSSPGGIIISPFYHYFPPYAVVDTLFPGKGYWVKVSTNGILYFSASSLNPPAVSGNLGDAGLPPQPPDGEISNPKSQIPNKFSLGQNYPNPFNPSTTIRYELPSESRVALKVFNHLGQEVNTLVEQVQEAGFKSVEWNGTNNAGETVASGVYFYRLTAGDFVQTKKLILLR